ncbi:MULTISPECIES: ComEA family DNA-binding protein [Silvimonas]|uniref:ComEA family DNA-binding protein n=1 Tax=Silvimonas TaxID=300264 RepID=UPI0024B32803|nr:MULTISPECIES: ComEA family DNA-binding protein [Silvimonas]MDR3428035.1 ComEA family DNA-binding protein [Silvimonas sp.]
MKKWFVALLSVFMLMGSAFAAVNINNATLEQLESLNGIGPSKAQAIIDYRTKTGPFKAPEDIMKVPGIKEGTYNKIKSDIAVSGATTAAAAAATKTPAPASKAPAAKATPTPAPAAAAATPTPKPTKPPKPAKTKASQ